MKFIAKTSRLTINMTQNSNVDQPTSLIQDKLPGRLTLPDPIPPNKLRKVDWYPIILSHLPIMAFIIHPSHQDQRTALKQPQPLRSNPSLYRFPISPLPGVFS